MPEKLEEGILYVSVEYCTALHKCVCGCGNTVVTPISPTDWQLKFDGKSISLSPSIGNWSFACRSHYWIDKNHIRWAGNWDKDQIEEGRKEDQQKKARYFNKLSISEPSNDKLKTKESLPKTSWSWRSIWNALISKN
ncbi:DUF6527 family protein [Mucilaginibacter oryzae]|nr:DUF6527 family protein [Mucilaginibacter oryzae]